MDGLGDEDDGLLWERDPAKHRRIAKTISPAFSANSLRAKDPTMHKHIDFMMTQLQEFGDSKDGTDLSVVCDHTGPRISSNSLRGALQLTLCSIVA